VHAPALWLSPLRQALAFWCEMPDFQQRALKDEKLEAAGDSGASYVSQLHDIGG
jgi:hypothetical protein